MGTPNHTFLGWYINLEAPFVRTEVGVDSTDHSLDVVIAPDMSWKWKDEETLPVLEDLGIYRRTDSEEFYEAGREAIQLLESRAFPFDGSYVGWLPPDGWSIPEAPVGWERVPG